MKGKKLGLVGITLATGLNLVTPVGASVLAMRNYSGTPSVGFGDFSMIHQDYFVEGINQIQEGADIGLDFGGGLDDLWVNQPDNQNDIWLKPYSIPFGTELRTDARPRDSNTPIDVNCSIVIKNGNLSPDSAPYLWANINDSDGAFYRKPMTFQQQSLTGDPNEKYPVIDIRKAIALNSKRIPLYDPNGNNIDLSQLVNGEVYAKGKVSFTKKLADIDNSGYVDMNDVKYVADNWLKEEFGNPADITGVMGIPDNKVDFLDLAEVADKYLEENSGE